MARKVCPLDDPQPAKPWTLASITRRKTFQGELAVIGYVFLTALNDLRDEAECLCADGDMCQHAFGTAKMFLLGSNLEWKRWRDVLCGLVGQDPAHIERRAREVLARRAEFQAKDAARKRVVA